MKFLKIYAFLSLLGLNFLLPANAHAQTPTVNGRYTDDSGNYSLLASAPGDRAKMYYHKSGNTLYLLVRVSPTKVNDNVFGDQSMDNTYLDSVDWNNHNFKHLEKSDHMELSLQAGSYSYNWSLDYLDGDFGSWSSGIGGDDGGGTPPPGFVSATSLEWNMKNSSWDITLGGTRTSNTEYKSPPLDGYSGFSSTYQWEWPLVYEMSFDISAFANENIFVSITTAHNSPSKDSDEDVVILKPSIDLEKYTNGEDADSPTGPTIPVGGVVNWTYVVTNTGRTTLTNVTVTDDQGVLVTLLTTTLAPGESTIGTAFGTAVLGQYANIGTTTGDYPLGQVSDTDPSHYIATGPGIHIEKSTNGSDADTPTGPSIPVGDAVTWEYVVTNTGNVPISSVVVTDNITGVNPQYVSGDTNQDGKLDVTETWIYQATGVATLGQYANEGTVTGKDPDDGDVTDDDPSHYYGTEAGIHIEKSTNGSDADTPTGPSIPVGDAVTWEYVVTNTGNVPISSVVVTDNITGVNPQYVSGDTNQDGILDVTETWIYQATGVATPGQYANEGTVTGKDPDDGDVTDDDPSHYFGTGAGIHIEKSTNGSDADTPTGPSIPVGAAVTWEYVVTNTGNVPISSVVVTDNITGVNPQYVSGDTNQDGKLDVTETWIYQATGVATPGQYANEGTVTGKDPDDGDVTDDDPSHYYGTEAGIHIEKSTNGSDADTPTGPSIPVGDAVTWEYVVTNTGNVPISSVVVTDNITGVNPQYISGDTNQDGILDVTETWIYQATGVATLGQYANEGTVTGMDPDDKDVTDDDPSHYYGLAGSIGDFLWNDANLNGIQDNGESGIDTVTIKLYSGSGTFLKDTKTDGAGAYSFDGLPPGDYYIEFVRPSGYIFTLKDQGSDDGKDSDADQATGKTIITTLTAGENDSTWDAGLIAPASVSDYVWNDINANGIQEQGENGINGVLVKIYEDVNGNGQAEPEGADGSPVATMTTIAGPIGDGYYIFDDLFPGAYFLVFELPSGYRFSPANAAGDALDSDADEGTGVTKVLTLSSGENDTSWDAGMFLVGKIGDHVWYDADQDGKEDWGFEPGLDGVRIRLYSSGPTKIIYTHNGGWYNFKNLPPGKYTVDVDESTLPPNYQLTTANEPHDVTLSPGEIYHQADFGYYEPFIPNPFPGSIGDYVWVDTNKNGLQDEVNTGIPDITLYLFDGQGTPLDTTTTDGDGYYLFEDLDKGTYLVDVHEDDDDMPGGHFCTTYNDPMTVNLAQEEDFLDADFGFAPNDWGKGRNYLLARYQPWYGGADSDSTLRYWDVNYMGGHADTSLFNTYDSYDPNVWEYHILLAWASGIDGFAVDWYGKSSYENPGIKGLLDTADDLYDRYNEWGFNFEIAASYNETAYGMLDTNFIYIGDSLMPHLAYWGTRRNVRRPVFLFNTDEVIYEPSDYRACADTTLPPDKFLLWNGTETFAFDPVDVCYPWVQPLNGLWDVNGMEWGDTYLDTTYWRMNYLPDPGDLMFALGAVWPGFDDYDWSLGLDHWMSRQDTLVYEKTWEKVDLYNYPLPMPWVMVETWNDLNQATEIEPGLKYDYKFIVLTRDHARVFKSSIPPDSVGVENLGLLVPQHIHQARIAAELRPGDAGIINSQIDQALDHFFNKEYLEALSVADQAAGIPPGPYTVDIIGDTFRVVTWQASVHANAYNIYYSQDSSRFEPCAFQKPDVIRVGNVTEYTLEGLEPNTNYYIAVTAVDTNLGLYANDSWYASSITGSRVIKTTTGENTETDITVGDDYLPMEFSLLQNYPNPFNPVTTIQYTLPVSQHVVLKLYDIQGREKATLVDAEQQAGMFTIHVDGTELASGIYFYQIITDNFTAIRKMILLK